MARRAYQQTKPDIKNPYPTVKRIWRYLGAEKVKLIFVLIFVLITALLSLLAPYLLGVIVDDFIEQQDSQLLSLLVMLFSVYLFTAIFTFLQHWLMIGIAQGTVYTMRETLFNKLHRLPIRFFDRNQDGDVMSRLTNDIENVSQTLNSSVIQVFSSGLTLIGTLIVMISLSLTLTAVTLTIVPVLYFGMKWITKRTRVFYREQQKNLGSLNGFIEEAISGQSVVKIFSQEDRFNEDFDRYAQQLRESGYKAQSYAGFIPKLMNMLNNMSFAVLAFIGGILALNQLVSVGMIVTFTQYARQFTRPLNDLANQFNTLLSAVAGAERVFDVIDEEEDYRPENPVPKQDMRGSIVFNDVTFAYEGEDTVKNISLTADPGETIALVGPTGAGKTTILNLISRFYLPSSGRITLDGTDLLVIKEEDLRSEMGFVLQDAFLFEGTIRENLIYGKQDATDLEIRRAIEEANAARFIDQLPNGIDTILDQDGSGISQGEKQLLAIARVLLKDPKLLILDEATSSIDTVTEIHIQEALTRLMKDRTSIVIAHRLNTIQHADRIYVLNEGEIIESGSHESLLDRGGFYQNLYQHGFEDGA